MCNRVDAGNDKRTILIMSCKVIAKNKKIIPYSSHVKLVRETDFRPRRYGFACRGRHKVVILCNAGPRQQENK